MEHVNYLVVLSVVLMLFAYNIGVVIGESRCKNNRVDIVVIDVIVRKNIFYAYDVLSRKFLAQNCDYKDLIANIRSLIGNKMLVFDAEKVTEIKHDKSI